MILIALVVLALFTALFTTIQTFYLESMRLRTRELPSLSWFREVLEPKMKTRSTEEGATVFSLWKHTCLVVMGVLALAQVLGPGPMSPVDFWEGLGAAVLLMAFSAYLVPQVIYERSRCHWMLALLPILLVAKVIVRPFVLALHLLHVLIDIVKPQPENEDKATPAENIDTLITAGTEEGLIKEDDRKLIESVIAFGDKVVREVMTPRPNMITVRAEDTLAQLHQLVVNEQYSRIPVSETSIDEIVGFVHVRDMFEVAEKDREIRRVRELMRPVRLVPETKLVHELMREMQQDGSHMVIVVDEYGNTAGLATMEDLVEVIVGEIRDEHEPGSDIGEDGQGGFVVSGNFDLARLGDLLDFHAEEDVESTTIGGLITEWLGHVPKAGETIERDGLRAEVLAADEMRVEQVKLSRVAEEAPAGE
ncbi:MAG TPA: hemolysin family protein [Bryobacteraceae bacterium]|nr:hemolysin family protein [Bryobacteraceae bacterium]